MLEEKDSLEKTATVETFRENSFDLKSNFQWLYSLDKFGIEVRGIERVSPEERDALVKNSKFSKERQFLDVIGLWISACGGLTSMSSFFLPSLLYGLKYNDSLISGLISMILGCLVPAFCSIMGAKSGCRQMVSAKFLFGVWSIKAIAILVIISGLGWSVVNCVLGGQLLTSISSLPLVAGIIIISLISLLIAVFGIRVLLMFQNIFAIPMIIATILFYILVCKKYSYIAASDQMLNNSGMSTATYRGNWISFFTIGYSVTSTWGSGASDYYILFPESTPSWQIFCLTFFGMSIPTTFVAVAGVLCGNIAYSYEPWKNAYDENGIGGLISEACKPWGNFGKFIVVLFYISLVCNNIMNTYSCALEFQLISSKFMIVPRWIWAIVTTAIYLIISLVGREHLSTIIGNFLPMLAYWVSIYITLLLEETILFRMPRKLKKLHYKEFDSDGFDMPLYNWERWNSSSNLSFGIAVFFAFMIGVAGAVLGMNQVYWRGPLARKLGDDGGDIGVWLCIAFSGLSYPGIRYLELKKMRK